MVISNQNVSSSNFFYDLQICSKKFQKNYMIFGNYL